MNPFSGTWAPNLKRLIQPSADAMVLINRRETLPSCGTCRRGVNLRDLITSISVDLSTDTTATNASLELSAPRIYGDSIFNESSPLIRVGQEVHINLRGFFPLKGLADPGDKEGDVFLSEVSQYPYYPVFHGVITSVSAPESGGFYSATITCNGMLHFWSYTQISNDGSFFGSRPSNSGVRTTITGHPYSGMTPHAIIYDLYRNTTGAAAGVGFALQSRTNFSAVSSTTGDTAFSLAMRYWEKRFGERAYGLRMHGASGQMFSTSQQVYIAQHRNTRSAGRIIAASLNGPRGGRDPYLYDHARILGLADHQDGRVLRQPDLNLLPSRNGGSSALNVTQMQAFVTDYGSFGNVNLFESSYESKLDIASRVVQVSGFEFFQDADGDLVFKPPLYNLDTKSSRIYRIELVDTITITPTESEPEATYVVVKAGPFQNTRGVVDQAELGVRAVYVNYPLVAQFGWREHSLETSYVSDARSASFVGAVALDRINVSMNSCTVQIPLRPELRPGFPVYVAALDCYYYAQSLSHSFTFGGQCTTSLNLVARRKKFVAPGSISAGGVQSVDLSDTSKPPRPLQTLSSEGVPRVVGFPNVVMALDITRINPQFFAYGLDLEESSLTSGTPTQRSSNRDLFVSNFAQLLLSKGLISLASSANGNPTEGPWAIRHDEYSMVTLTKSGLRQALDSYLTFRGRIRERDSELSRRDRSLALEYQRLSAITNPTPAQEQRMDEVLSQRRNVQSSLETLRSNFDPISEQTLSRPGIEDSIRATSEVLSGRGLNETNRPPSREPTVSSSDVSIFTFLISHIRESGDPDSRRDPTGSINETANILDLLSDRKASLSVHVPGYYRYYSSAHPNPDQQGDHDLVPSTSSSPRPDTSTESPSPVSFRDGSDPILSGGSRPLGSRTPVTGSRLRPGAGNSFDAPSLESNVADQRTPMTPIQAAAYLREAWRSTHNGEEPLDAVMAVLLAQWALESGRGRQMYNFNYGGVKASGGPNDTGWHGASVRLLTRENGNPTLVYRNFRAYGSARQGAQDYLGLLLRRYPSALQAVQSSGDITRFVPNLNGYQTGSRDSYRRQIEGLAREALRVWIPKSRAFGVVSSVSETPAVTSTTAESAASRSPSTETVAVRPGPTMDSPPERVSVPDRGSLPERGSPTGAVDSTASDHQSVQLANATSVRGIPENLRKDFVEYVYGRPRRGLKVRVPSSRNLEVVPTDQIRTLTFSEVSAQRTSSIATISLRDGHTVDSLSTYFRTFLRDPPLTSLLARHFEERLGEAMLSRVSLTSGELIESAVAGIFNLTGYDGSPISSPNITNGTPNRISTFRGSDVTNDRVLSVDRARELIYAKSKSLLVEISIANSQALEGLSDSNLSTSLLQWTRCLSTLFGGSSLPSGIPLSLTYQTNRVTSEVPSVTPVFPISDERGYEHFGSLQYGRGLSIEPGGNYERLMSADPLRYANPALVHRFVQSFSTSPVRRDPEGRVLLSQESTAILRDIASDPGFQESIGAQSSLRYSTGGSDRVDRIANGLSNFFLSDRDSNGKLTVSNVARGLADLRPEIGGGSSCSCRGVDADLLLAAYDSGLDGGSVIPVTDNSVYSWSAQQSARASVDWQRARSALMGEGVSSSPANSYTEIDSVLDSLRRSG